LRAGQWVEIITPGGGGYGPPARRSAEALARDLREGRISTTEAETLYRR
jgi:N-methylhydantoinase B